jgi:hypothetical protein
MGLGASVPEADEIMKRAIVIGNLTPKEVKSFFRKFRKFDKERTGICSTSRLCCIDIVHYLEGLAKLTTIFESIEEQRTVFTDSILDLLG